MSNNIYDILKKMQSLEGPSTKKSLNESKSIEPVKTLHNESKQASTTFKGAIAEAVKQVEEALTEKYMGFKKTVAAIKKGGSADDPEAVAASIGRKKYGKAKFQKAAASGKKLGESPKDGAANIRVIGGGKPDMGEIQKDLDWAAQGHGYQDTEGTYYDRAGNPNLNRSKQKQMDKDTSYPVYKTGTLVKDANEAVLTPKQKKFAKLAPPPDKITYADKIAGAKKGMKKEGNAFSGAVAKAKSTGTDEFKVGGKEYKVQEGFPSKEDAAKRMKEKEGVTAHGKKTTTVSGVKHERDYDKQDSEKDTGEDKKSRGRPKKDKFAR